jgi:hypothetical protein
MATAPVPGPAPVPVHITFRHLRARPEAEGLVRTHVERLRQRCDRLVDCRVSIEVPHRSRASARPFRVRVELGVPRERLVVTRDVDDAEPPRELDQVLREVFDAAERRLLDYVDRLREPGRLRAVGVAV